MAKLDFPEREVKKKVGFYLPEHVIDYIKRESAIEKVSQNDFLTALCNSHAERQRKKEKKKR